MKSKFGEGTGGLMLCIWIKVKAADLISKRGHIRARTGSKQRSISEREQLVVLAVAC